MIAPTHWPWGCGRWDCVRGRPSGSCAVTTAGFLDATFAAGKAGARIVFLNTDFARAPTARRLGARGGQAARPRRGVHRAGRGRSRRLARQVDRLDRRADRGSDTLEALIARARGRDPAAAGEPWRRRDPDQRDHRDPQGRCPRAPDLVSPNRRAALKGSLPLAREHAGGAADVPRRRTDPGDPLDRPRLHHDHAAPLSTPSRCSKTSLATVPPRLS